MDTKIKQRWIGLVILLAVLAIFIPLVFHNALPIVETQSGNLSLESKLEKLPISTSQPQKPKIMLKIQHQEDKVHAEQVNVKRPIAKAWCVQLGIFNDINHANALVTQLRQKGFDAYIQSITTSNSMHLSQVYLGPEVQKNRALQLKHKLETNFHLNGIIKEYKVKM